MQERRKLRPIERFCARRDASGAMLGRLEDSNQRTMVCSGDRDGFKVAHHDARRFGVHKVINLDERGDLAVRGICHVEPLPALLPGVHKGVAQKLAEARVVPRRVEVSAQQVSMVVARKGLDNLNSFAPFTLGAAHG